MCGLFGIAGPGINTIDMLVLSDLMHVSALRGIDGTGIAYGNSNDKKGLKISKVNSDFLYFKWGLTANEKRSLDSIMNNLFIGHCRYGTTGKKDIPSTQPFEFHNTIGVHNGTLEIDYETFNTDSEWLLNQIDTVGIEETVQFLSPKDSYALVWYNKATRMINFITNEKRDLFFATHKYRNVMYWASEADFLRLCLNRRELDYNLYRFAPNTWYMINPNRILPKKGDGVVYTKKPVLQRFYTPGHLPSDLTQRGPAQDV